MKPILFILSGLPGSGKSTLSQFIAKEYNALYLRIDTVEQGLRDLLGVNVQGEGYQLTHRIANDNLKLGLNVVADSCNPIIITRNEWQEVANKNNSIFINIEIICSDKDEHKRRIQARNIDIENLKRVTWEDVKNREYQVWENKRIIIDTANKSIQESFNELRKEIVNYLKSSRKSKN